ncbi:hypothetical protein LQL77_29850 [Rhodococcus cerastii]|nr:hypothetical protein [Rhodococcus cerastii]
MIVIHPVDPDHRNTSSRPERQVRSTRSGRHFTSRTRDPPVTPSHAASDLGEDRRGYLTGPGTVAPALGSTIGETYAQP